MDIQLTFELIKSASAIASLVFIIYFQYEMLKKGRKRTDLTAMVIRTVIVPSGFLCILVALALTLTWIITYIGIVISFLTFTKTEQWFRLNMRFIGQYDFHFKFLNHETESESLNVYKRRDDSTVLVSQLSKTNYEIVERMINTNFYKEMVNTYFDLHPELTTIEELVIPENDHANGDERYMMLQTELNELRDQILLMKKPLQLNKKTKKKRDAPKVNQIEEEDELDDEEDAESDKLQAHKVLDHAYNNWYFHRLFTTYDFWKIRFDEELRSDLQILVVSFEKELPYDLLLTCTQLHDEIVEGKKFTTFFAIEGILDNKIAKRITNNAYNLELFKDAPYFGNSETILRQLESTEGELNQLRDDYEKLRKIKLHNAAVVEKAKRSVIKEVRDIKKKRWFDRSEEEDEE